jgi:hypothetical protein
MLRLWLPLVLIFVMPGTAARADSDETAVRALIADWYAELRKGKDARVFRLLAPGGIMLPRHCPDRCGPQPRALKPDELFRPRYLAEQAEKFAYEVERLRVERTLARADVWERGWRWAWAVKQTTMTAAAATFILEKREGEGWKILVYQSESRALSPKDKDMPMPDLTPKAQ